MKNLNIRAFYSIPWIKYLFWTVVAVLGIVLIALLANYLTIVVFNF